MKLMMTRALMGIGVSALAPASQASAQTSAMSFDVHQGVANCDGCMVIEAKGEIRSTTAKDFRSVVSENRDLSAHQTTVVFSSPGGDLKAGLDLGRAIRSLSFDTHIGTIKVAENKSLAISAADCASACAYAFLGGVKRSVGDGSRFGLHQISTQSRQVTELGHAVSATQAVIAQIIRYISEMGASPEIVTIATSTRSDGINWLSMNKFASLAVTNAQGLHQQRPWKTNPAILSYATLWSVDSSGLRQLSTLSCNDWYKAEIDLSITLYRQDERTLSSVRNSAGMTVSNRYGSISSKNATVEVTPREVTLSMKVPYRFVREAAQTNTELTVKLSSPGPMLGHLAGFERVVSPLGLGDVLNTMSTRCPRLAS